MPDALHNLAALIWLVARVRGLENIKPMFTQVVSDSETNEDFVSDEHGSGHGIEKPFIIKANAPGDGGFAGSRPCGIYFAFTRQRGFGSLRMFLK
jgi:hypothetical protein